VLVEHHLAPSWAVVVIIGREFIITGLRSVAASEGIVIQAQSMGKLKMWAQCVAVVALLVAAANGPPPVSNFGLEYPAMFWQVPEVRTAFSDLPSFSITSNDWKVFGYLVGRAALWVSVITAAWSMWGYFAYFLNERRQADEGPK
jgi:CDP-diacylglycerol--glycerol-3-phosphate 3-phosphatidyltransferase